MKHIKKLLGFPEWKKILSISLWWILILGTTTWAIYAIDSIMSGWKVTSDTPESINLISEYKDCEVVTAPAGKSIFVPTKTQTEWNNFKKYAQNSWIKMSSCTQKHTCTGLPNNAQWNSASSYTQTWTSGNWTPAATTATYNTTASTTSCRYTCKSGYTWDGSNCKIPAINWSCGSSNWLTTYTKPTWNLCSSWTPTSVSDTLPWKWECSGKDWGSSTSCSANIPSNICWYQVTASRIHNNILYISAFAWWDHWHAILVNANNHRAVDAEHSWMFTNLNNSTVPDFAEYLSNQDWHSVRYWNIDDCSMQVNWMYMSTGDDVLDCVDGKECFGSYIFPIPDYYESAYILPGDYQVIAKIIQQSMIL